MVEKSDFFSLADKTWAFSPLVWGIAISSLLFSLYKRTCTTAQSARIALMSIDVQLGNLYYESIDGVLFNTGEDELVAYPGGRSGAYNIPGHVISIGSGAFRGSTNLTSVIIPDSVTSIGYSAFSGCTSLTCVVIPDSVTSIGSGAFDRCTSLTGVTVDLANPVYSSLDGVLFNKTQTTLIQFPGGMSGDYNIPDSVTSIEGSAFFLGSLTSVVIPDSVTNIGFRAFAGCTFLTDITVDLANPVYSSLDGVLFNKIQTTLIQFPGGMSGDYIIPDSVTSIGNFAFYFCFSLTSVVIPNSVTSIGDWAFVGCTSLTRVTIPASVTSIPPVAFAGCSSLTRVFIPDSVTSIGHNAFGYCTSLTSVFFAGEPPFDVGSGIFDNSSPTVYYRYIFKDSWGPTFADRPTAIWTEAGNAILVGGAIGFSVYASEGQQVEIQARECLISGDWDTIATPTMPEGDAYEFTNPDQDDYPGRFYRIIF